jgi:hypothetical protein
MHPDEKGRVLLGMDVLEVAADAILRRKRHVAERVTLIATRKRKEYNGRDGIWHNDECYTARLWSKTFEMVI